MISAMFAVFDQKAKAYMQPFFSQSAGTAARAFAVAVNDPTTMLSKHPEDFSLWEIGVFDDDSAYIHALSPLKNVCLAISLKESGNVNTNEGA